MRFDDRLTTLLAANPPGSAGRVALWMQIADVFAQSGGSIGEETRRAVVDRLEGWRQEVPEDRLRLVAASIASSGLPFELVKLFASEAPQVAAPVLARVKLARPDWVEIVHTIPPASRNLLRQRRDLPAEAVRTLAVYAPTDLALPHGESAERGTHASEPIQIRDLVARIEAYRKDHPPPKAPERSGGSATHPEEFRFETGIDGIVHWVDGIDRGALIGLTITDVAPAGQTGADRTIVAAFEARAAFENGRLFVAGSGGASSSWVVSGRPYRDRDGAFGGFRCLARRATREDAPPLLAGGLSADSVRQLVHELRTPLNAIRGFSEMIEGQFLGPVASGYRASAEAISREAVRLSAVIDDLDVAAKLDAGVLGAVGQGDCDIGRVVRRCILSLRALVDERRLQVQVTMPSDLPMAALAEADAERLVQRLLFDVAGMAETEDQLPISCAWGGNDVVLTIGKPRALQKMESEDLRRGIAAIDQKADGPALGFGFAFRLLEALAQSLGARLAVTDDCFALILPVVTDTAAPARVGNQVQ